MKLYVIFGRDLFFCEKVDFRAPTAQAEIAQNSSKKPNFSFLARLFKFTEELRF